MEQLSFRVYVTDTLQAITENTSVSAAGFTDGKVGKIMTRRWHELDKPAKLEETYTAEEIVERITEKLASL